MKRWHALSPNWAITLLLVFIVSLNPICSYFGFSLVNKSMTLALIPILLTLYFNKQKIMANIFFIIFMLYFLGIIFNVFDHFKLSSKLSESCFLGAYLLMVLLMMGKLKDVKLEGLVTWYFVIVFLINTYLMFLLFVALKDSFQDSVILTLTVSKGVILLVMAILAFAIYLSKDTTQSIIFLMVVCSFAFSDVLSLITASYIHFWLYEGVQYILQGVGLILYCVYVYNYQEAANSVDGLKESKSIARSNNQVSVQS
ncbi:hypothetical protein M8845_08490 [Gelidibacter japonicus]|uniref:hypothetical protein n=1 Tax=Gelidibacter japonicus TaxID=1962232 RepID=UPI0020209137|nr:hypothetical protein [Gelidibacter japonicus]MCL8007463.1 hypothetical protein [Gelidibacter japonicus]